MVRQRKGKSKTPSSYEKTRGTNLSKPLKKVGEKETFERKNRLRILVTKESTNDPEVKGGEN